MLVAAGLPPAGRVRTVVLGGVWTRRVLVVVTGLRVLVVSRAFYPKVVVVAAVVGVVVVFPVVGVAFRRVGQYQVALLHAFVVVVPFKTLERTDVPRVGAVVVGGKRRQHKAVFFVVAFVVVALGVVAGPVKHLLHYQVGRPVGVGALRVPPHLVDPRVHPFP